MGISGSLSALRVPEVIFEASTLDNVVVIETPDVKSDDVEPVTAPVRANVLAEDNFVAVVGKAALVTVTVCPDTVTPDTY